MSQTAANYLAFIAGMVLLWAAMGIGWWIDSRRSRRAASPTPPLLPSLTTGHTQPGKTVEKPHDLPLTLPDAPSATADTPQITKGTSDLLPPRQAGVREDSGLVLWDQPARFLADLLRDLEHTGGSRKLNWTTLWDRYERWAELALGEGETMEQPGYLSQRLQRLGCVKLELRDEEQDRDLARGVRRRQYYCLPSPRLAPAPAMRAAEATPPLRRAA